MVVYTYNPSTQEGGELKASLGYIMKAHTPEQRQNKPWLWQHTPVILALGRQRQKDHFVFEASLVYTGSFRPSGHKWDPVSNQWETCWVDIKPTFLWKGAVIDSVTEMWLQSTFSGSVSETDGWALRSRACRGTQHRISLVLHYQLSFPTWPGVHLVSITVSNRLGFIEV